MSGWKSLSEPITLNLRKLTVLAGPNSSGKSSFFQPVLMLKQTLEAPYDPGALLLDGPHVRFTEASQFLSQCEKQDTSPELVIGIEAAGNFVESTYSKSAGKPIEVIRERFGSADQIYTVSTGMSAPELRKQLSRHDSEFISVLSRGSSEYEIAVGRSRCFLAVQFTVGRGPGQKMTFALDNGQTAKVTEAIRSIIHLPGLRGNPERTYPLNATEGFYPGQFQNYTASLIQRWKDAATKDKLIALNNALTDLELTSEITTAPVDETRVEIKVGRVLGSGSDEFVSIADVGLAVSQVLPVLVALVAAAPGQLVFVEQPELHLHPRAQVKLAKLLAVAVNRGVRVLLETHSSLLLLGVQTAIASGCLAPEDVGLNWFTRNEKGMTCVKAADIDRAGSFGDWPEDFGYVSLEAESHYLDAAEKVLLAEQHA